MMTLWLLVPIVVLAAAFGYLRWKARTSELRAREAFEQQRNLATKRLELAIAPTSQDNPEIEPSKVQSASASKSA